MAIIKVDLQKSYRILNPGATTLVSAKYGGDVNAMAITWAQALDYDKVTIVPHNGSYTRTLVEKSGYFAVQIPTAAQAELVSELGAENNSRFDNADKMKNVEIFYKEEFDVPLIAGCAAWLVCKRIPEPHNEQSYDLFIGEVIAAYADERIFDGGHWLFEKTPDELKTLHYVAGGRYYLDGKAVDTKRTPISGETGKIALVVGATGVVGREILKLLLNEPSYDKIVVWTRRELEFSHKKLEVKLINFDEISKIPPQKIDEVFCALGTTIKKAGSKEAFLKIDVEYVEETAKWAKNAGARRFVLVSSPGANEGSLSFYLRAKGRIERRVSKLGFDSLQIVHPPIILGERSDARPLERLATAGFKLLPACVFGKFRPLSGASIARVMINVARSDARGVQIYEPREFL